VPTIKMANNIMRAIFILLVNIKSLFSPLCFFIPDPEIFKHIIYTINRRRKIMNTYTSNA